MRLQALLFAWVACLLLHQARAGESAEAGAWVGLEERSPRQLRPSRTFDLFAQQSPVPENLLNVRRRVTKLFVIPALSTAPAAGVTRGRARSLLHLATWLLTHDDPNGAVVLTAHQEVEYETLLQAMHEQQRTNVSANVLANIMISPVSFAESRAMLRPEERFPAMWGHIAGIDAAEQRYEPEHIVLLDAPEPKGLFEFPGVDSNGCARNSHSIELPNATVAPGAPLLRDFHASEWRWWYVRHRDDAATVPAIHTVARTWPLEKILEHRLGAKREAQFRPYEASSVRTACPTRHFPTTVVMVAGSSDLIMADQILTILSHNPDVYIVVVAANVDVPAWIDKHVPLFYRGNVHVSLAPPTRPQEPLPGVERRRRPGIACIELRELEPAAINVQHEDACLGAMVRSVIATDASGRLVPRVRTDVLALLPLRSTSMPFPGAGQRLANVSSWQTMVALPSPQSMVLGVLGVDTALDLVTHGELAADPPLDPLGVRVIGRELARQARRAGEPLSIDAFSSWVFDLRGLVSEYETKFPQWRGWYWPVQDVRATLKRAEESGALIVHPVETARGIGNSPWRYQIRRQRFDPITVRSMEPGYKADLWCDVDTLEGCSNSITIDIRFHPACERRNERYPLIDPINCANVSADPRVRPQDVRPLRLRQNLPSLANTSDAATERERDAPVGSRVKADVLFSVICKGDEDFVDIAEMWLEYCESCVIAIEVGPSGNPGAVYDTLAEGLEPSVFDRVIVNPKRGHTDPFRPPLLLRHLVNVKYARCFVAPLRVLMVAANEAQFRPGLAEYMLAHSTNQLFDLSAVVHEAKRDDPHWLDDLFLGTAARITRAAHQFVFSEREPPMFWMGHPHSYCTGKAFYDQTKTFALGMLGFEGSWYTGAQWNKFDETFKLGYWVYGFPFIEHMYPQPTITEDELRRLYLPETSFNITNNAKPPGRNTCVNARLHLHGPMTLDELQEAMARAAPVHFTMKRVDASISDPARQFLTTKRRREVAERRRVSERR